MGVEEHSNLNVGRISVKPISRSRILIHITIYSLGQSVEKIDPATGVTAGLLALRVWGSVLHSQPHFCLFVPFSTNLIDT